MTETIVIFRIGSLGDTVVALPCFHRIAQSFPNARRVLVTDTPTSQKVAPVESVLGGSGLIDEVIYFPAPPRRLVDFVRLRAAIQRTGARTLIYVADRPLASALRDMAFFRACGLKRIIGPPLARELRDLRVDARTGDTEREAERLARCLAELGPIDLDDPAVWDLRLQPSETKLADEALAPLLGRDFIAVNVGGKVEAKDWGDENWRALLAQLAPDHTDLALVFFGSSDEASRSQSLADLWPGEILNLCGRLSPRESAAALRRALMFMGHDSGPLHLASAMGAPCVGVFGPHNMPKWWHPMGEGHRILHNMGGLREITPGQVRAAVDATLRDARRSDSPRNRAAG